MQKSHLMLIESCLLSTRMERFSMESMDDSNKYSITLPLMQSPSISRLRFLLWCHAFCISSESIHVPFFSFDSFLRFADVFLMPLDFLLYYLIASHFPSHSSFFRCLIVAAYLSTCTRCGWSLASFNLPNKPTASFSPIMCVCERDMLFCLFWIGFTNPTIKCFPKAVLGSHCSFSILIYWLDLRLALLLGTNTCNN